MPALLMLKVQPPGGETAALVDEALRRHGGTILESAEGSHLASFATSPEAISCALETQAGLIKRNRAAAPEGRALSQCAVHVAKGLPATEVEARAASLLLDLAPPGRVFLSRQAYSQAQGSAACGFIPLGEEFLTGLPEPLDLYEAVPLYGYAPSLMAASMRTSPGRSAAPAATTMPSATAPGWPTGAPATNWPVRAPATPMVLATAAAAGLVLYLARKPALALLVPFDLLDYVFHSGGHLVFGEAGSPGSAGSIGAIMTQTATPSLFDAVSWAQGDELKTGAGLLWLGHVLLALGSRMVDAVGDPSTFTGCEQVDAIELFRSLGLTHFRPAGHALALSGALLIAWAASSLYLKFQAPTK